MNILFQRLNHFHQNICGNPDSLQAFLNKNVHHLVPHVIILTAVNVGKFASPNLTPMDFIASKIGMKTRYMITENFPFIFPHLVRLLKQFFINFNALL